MEFLSPDTAWLLSLHTRGVDIGAVWRDPQSQGEHHEAQAYQPSGDYTFSFQELDILSQVLNDQSIFIGEMISEASHSALDTIISQLGQADIRSMRACMSETTVGAYPNNAFTAETWNGARMLTHGSISQQPVGNSVYLQGRKSPPIVRPWHLFSGHLAPAFASSNTNASRARAPPMN